MQTGISVLGIDIGKNIFSLVGLDVTGRVVLGRRAKRETVMALAAKLPPCVVAMEACCGAHHLGRIFATHGHETRLMAPKYVRPYVKAQKNDDRDAEGTAEAATRPTMRFVALKSQDQLDSQTLHRARDRLVGERTAIFNQLRSMLLERGVVVAKGKRNVEKLLASLSEGTDDYGLSTRVRSLVVDMHAQWVELNRRIQGFNAEFLTFVRQSEDARLLGTIPGVGPLIASALVAAIGAGDAFEHGRDLAAANAATPINRSSRRVTKTLLHCRSTPTTISSRHHTMRVGTDTAQAPPRTTTYVPLGGARCGVVAPIFPGKMFSATMLSDTRDTPPSGV